jgi:hypothetical protein
MVGTGTHHHARPQCYPPQKRSATLTIRQARQVPTGLSSLGLFADGQRACTGCFAGSNPPPSRRLVLHAPDHPSRRTSAYRDRARFGPELLPTWLTQRNGRISPLLLSLENSYILRCRRNNTRSCRRRAFQLAKSRAWRRPIRCPRWWSSLRCQSVADQNLDPALDLVLNLAHTEQRPASD